MEKIDRKLKEFKKQASKQQKITDRYIKKRNKITTFIDTISIKDKYNLITYGF